MRNLRRVLLTALLTVPVLAIQSSSAQATDLSVLESEYKQNPSLDKLVQLGQAYLNAGRTSDAVTAFEEAIRADYNNYAAHFGLGVALFQLNDLNGASFEFLQLTALNPKLMQGYYNLAAAQARQGKTDDAIKSLQQAVDVGKANQGSSQEITLALTELARLYTLKADHTAARTSYEEALKLNPMSESLMLAVAQSAYASSQVKKDPLESAISLSYAYQILAKNPAQADATLVVVDNFVSQGVSDRALRELDKGLAVATENAQKIKLLTRKAQVLEDNKQLKQAVDALQQVLALDANNAAVKYNAARLMLATQNYAGAQTYFQQLAAVSPTEQTYLGLAQTSEALKQYAAAYNNALNAAKLSKDVNVQTQARTLAVRNAYRAGQHALAVKTLQAIENPGVEALTWGGLSAYTNRDYARAVEFLDAASKLDPKNQLVAVNLAAAHLALSQFDSAERVLSAVVAADKTNAEAWYNYGIALRGLGNEIQARQAFQQALNLGHSKAKGALSGK